MAAEEAVIPQWAANLQASVARIEGQVVQIPDIVKELKEVRANTVPMQEHLKLMADVETLKERDLGARSDWDDLKGKVLDPKGQLQTMWDERAQIRGGMRLINIWVLIVSFVVLVLGFILAARSAGIHVST